VKSEPSLHVISEVELPLEGPRRNTPVEVLALGLRLVAFYGDHILLGRNQDFVGRKAGDRKRNLVAIFA
jgi:hypothetical protein